MGSNSKHRITLTKKGGNANLLQGTAVRALPCVHLDPHSSLIATCLKKLQPLLDGIHQDMFKPDPWAIQSLWPDFLNTLTFKERLALDADLTGEGSKVLFKLFSIDWMSRYEKTTREAVRLFEGKVKKNTFGTTVLDGFKYQIAFFAFLQNGPKLSMEKDLMSVVEDKNKGDSHDIDADNTYYSIFSIIVALLNSFKEEIADNSIDLDLLVYWVNSLDLQDVAAIKTFCQIPLDEDEKQQSEVPLRTLNDIRRFKERIFIYGAWATTSGMVYTSFCTSPIDHAALFRKLLEVKRNNGSFDGLKHIQKKEVQLRTYFSGVRTMTVYQICRQRWCFTDPYEAAILCLYLDEHIDALMSIPK